MRMLFLSFLIGIALKVLDAAVTATPFLPTIAAFAGELLTLVAIVVILFIGKTLRARTFSIVAVAMGFWLVPNLGSTVAYFWTRDEFIGTIQRTYLDEAKDGTGTRAIFVIQDHGTCEVGSYVSRDEVILALGIIPLVYHDDSQVTRDKLATMVGRSARIWDVHDRRTRRQMPLLGVVGGTVTALFGADWTSFPNVYHVEEAVSPNPCP